MYVLAALVLVCVHVMVMSLLLASIYIAKNAQINVL